MPNLRLTVVQSGVGRTSPLLFDPAKSTFAQLLTLSGQRLKMKAKRAFLSTGTELSADNYQSLLENDAKVMLTKGEGYESHLTKRDGESDTKVEPATSSASVQPPVVRVLAVKSWLDADATKQLENTAKSLPGIRLAVGMPDLHPGQGFPVGTAFCATSIYPHLIGGDIGCGMSLIQTALKADKTTDKKTQKWVERLQGLEQPWQGNVAEWLQRQFEWPAGQVVEPVTRDEGSDTDESANEEEDGKQALPSLNIATFDNALGTIGGGNHFAELQSIHEVVDAKRFAELKMDSDSLYLLVHSGSRGFGTAVLDQHAHAKGTAGLHPESDEAKRYLTTHNTACAWAKRNRALIAQRFLSCLGTSLDTSRCVMDVWHNNVVPKTFSAASLRQPGSEEKKQTEVKDEASQTLWLHRKGAAPADMGPLVIPGSRGAFSYLVQPTTDIETLEHAGFSLAHGAGRKWNRSRAQAKMKERYKHEQHLLQKTELDSHVICEDKDLLYEEAPQAYKEITEIIEDLADAKLVTVIAILKPVITYKMRQAPGRDS